jgi:integrase/recombinase XerD
MSVSSFQSLIQRFFTDRLQTQLGASQYTIAAYRDTFRLLLQFASERIKRAPSELRMEDLDTSFLGQFLEHHELDRGNCTRTRNNRLSAVHAFFQYVAISEPALALQCQRVFAIPSKRYERGPVEFLTEEETAALVATPDPGTWIGRRDKALLLVAVQTGLRNSEITSLRRQDVEFGTGATCVASERVGRCAARRYGQMSPRSSKNGWHNRTESQTIPSSPVRMEGTSVPTHSSDSSPDISRPHVGLVRRWRRRR